MYIEANLLRLDHWSSQTTLREPIVLNKWYHVVAGHRGGSTPSLTNDFIYIDGLPEIDIYTSARMQLRTEYSTLHLPVVNSL
jgi:hypothetical protein